jgi:hypothetical protein
MKRQPKQEKTSNDIIKLFAILIVIFIVAFALGAYIRNASKPKLVTEYSNGYTFTKSGSFWYTTIRNPILNQEYNVEFRYAPSEVKDVPVLGDPQKFFRLLQINNLTGAYFTFNPTENLTFVNVAGADLAKFMKVINGVTLVPACTVNETDPCHSRPIITCESQKDKAMVIYVDPSPQERILMEENCLTLQGEGDGIIRAYTKLLFLWYNVL